MTTDNSQGRVVLTHGRSLMALAAAWSLGRRGVEVIGADDAPMNALTFSRYATDAFLYDSPDLDQGKFVDSLAARVAQHAPEDPTRPYLVIPMHRYTGVLARERHRFEPRARVAVPPYEAIEATNAKHRLVETVERYGVEAPASRVVRSVEEARDVNLDEPVIVKPSVSHGGRGLQKVKRRQDLEEAVAFAIDTCVLKTAVIQEAVEGEDYCLTALCAEGRIAISMAYLNVETWPSDGGFGLMRETVPVGPMPAIAEKLTRPLNWHGIIQLDFRWTGRAEDTPKLIEVNPRFFGGLFQAIDSGVDYPWLLYRLFADGVVEEQPEIAIGHQTRVPVLWLASLAHDLVPGKFERLGEAFEAARAVAGEDGIWPAIKDFSERLGEEKPQDDKRLAERLKAAAQARPELFSTDDPFAGLGVLYVLGSLVRYGRLPVEMTRK